jgi:hypothetical protein
MGIQVSDRPDGYKALIDPKHKTEMEQALLVVVRHIQNNHSLAPSFKRNADGSKKEYDGNESVDLQ